jgi:hypothetical protein
VACIGIIFDLLRNSPLIRQHAANGTVVFGINHEMRDFRNDRKKNLDLVLCTPSSTGSVRSQANLCSLQADYGVALADHERAELAALPTLRKGPVGAVLMALEAKACMTAHQRALPRLYDELNSSHATVHGATAEAIAVGFAMVNIAEHYLSPDLNKENLATSPRWSAHRQPRDASLAIEKLRQLPRRTTVTENGYDAFSIAVVEMCNDGSDVTLRDTPPAPTPGDIYHYASMIDRITNTYATRFQHIG